MKHQIKKIFMLGTAFAILIFSQANAQKKPIDLKDIDKENLKMEVYPKDSSANAMIICDYGHSFFRYLEGFKIQFERHVRKKIFNKNGYSEADFSIPLYSNGDLKEDITSVRAYTYNLKDGKVKRTRFKRRNIYYEEKNENLRYAKFSLPDVHEGSVIEVRYRITSDFLYSLRDWSFQRKIPVKWSEYVVEIPEYFHYNQRAYGFEPYKIKEKETVSDHISFGYNSGKVRYQKTVYRYVAENLPAFKEGPYLSSARNFMNRIEFELAKVEMPNSNARYYSNSWESIKNDLYKHGDFGRELRRANNYLNDIAEEIRTSHETQEARMQAAFNYIKSRMKWNSNYSKYSEESLRKAWKAKSGNVADINLLLTVLLKKLDIYANPVILSTRAHGLIHPSYPSLNQTNYVIANAKVRGENYLLDATEPYNRINMLPSRCLNGTGRLIAEEKTRPVNLRPDIPFKETNFAMIRISEDHVEANIKTTKTKYAAHNFRRKLEDYKDKDELTKEIENNNNFKINQLSFKNLDSLHKPISIRLDSVIISDYTKAGNMIYFNPIIYKRLKKNPFKLEDRKYPVDYPYPKHVIYRYQITIPDGYKVESLPEKKMIKTPGNKAQFAYSTKRMGNRIIITNIMAINKTRFINTEYADLKNFYDQILKKHSEQIVLKKVNTADL